MFAERARKNWSQEERSCVRHHFTDYITGTGLPGRTDDMLYETIKRLECTVDTQFSF